MAYQKAMAARTSVLHVIARKIEQDKDTGEDKIAITDGSSFVIKVNLKAQESILLTCAHVVSGNLIPNSLRVKMMAPYGVQEYPAHIVHFDSQLHGH